MQRTDPFCKCISKRLLNGKAPHHEFDTFTHMKGLLYKHVMDTGKQFLTLVIPKSWKYTVLVEAFNKLGYQGNSCMYCLIKRQYYWKGMNKDIRKYIANCILLPQHTMTPSICDFSVQISNVSCSITSKKLLKN